MSSTQSNSKTAASPTKPGSAPVMGSRRVQSAVIADLRSKFVELAKNNARPAPYLHAVMRAIANHHQHLGFSLNGHFGSETLSDFACVGTLTADQQLQLRQLTNQAALAGHAESNMRVTGPYLLE